MNFSVRLALLLIVPTLVVFTARVAYCGKPDSKTLTAAERGYRLLTDKAYLPPDFDQRTFDQLWRRWPEPLRSQAEAATPQQRRQMAYSRYGLTPRPGDELQRPLQYVVDEQGNWSMNCFACHQGKVAGRVIPGVPNSLFALETLTAEVRQTKLRTGTPLARMDVGSLLMPLGRTVGTTNAVMFGVALLNYRDADLNIYPDRPWPEMTHHDMDAPAWWHIRRKKRLYIDGFAPKGHRALMQFLLVRDNGPEKFRQWEDQYRDVLAYIESLEPPKYPFAIDEPLAARGKPIFRAHCSGCHGTYGADGAYPEKLVPIDEVGTDPVRLEALSVEHRGRYRDSWFDRNTELEALIDPGGYVAPPLDGVWATAPYFHNGSVPTLWHVLHPEQRPAIWRRTEDGYDRQKVGLEVTTFATMPPVETRAQRRWLFDTGRFGKSAAGHDFPAVLNEEQRAAVLEYLKTL